MPSEICLKAGAVLLTHPAWQNPWMLGTSLCWLAGGQVNVRETKLSPNLSFACYQAGFIFLWPFAAALTGVAGLNMLSEDPCLVTLSRQRSAEARILFLDRPDLPCLGEGI